MNSVLHPEAAAPDHGRSLVTVDAATAIVGPDAAPLVRAGLQAIPDTPGRMLVTIEAGDPEMLAAWAEALCVAIMTRHPRMTTLALDGATARAAAPRLLRQGIATACDGGALLVTAGMLWQRPAPWLGHDGDAGAASPSLCDCPYPYDPVFTGTVRHPRRPPAPEGVVYRRHIPWLDAELSFRVATIDQDLDRLHRWMNDPRVAAIWEEAGDLDKHRQYLGGILADPHMIPLIGCFDGAPFGYFEIYWARENRIGPFYDVDDYDRGWHVLVGEDGFRGRDYVSAWLPSLMHYLFLDDPRTRRIVGEPRADHAQQLRNLDRAGFARIKQFDFPHKRATLVMLLRERFFGDRLWLPDFVTAPADDADHEG